MFFFVNTFRELHFHFKTTLGSLVTREASCHGPNNVSILHVLTKNSIAIIYELFVYAFAIKMRP